MLSENPKSKDDDDLIEIMIDPRDGKIYRTKKIRDKVWMIDNLNYETVEFSICYDNNPINCNKYCRLYSFEAALQACPPGWTLPSQMDILSSWVNSEGDIEGYLLKKDFAPVAFGGICNQQVDDIICNSLNIKGAWWTLPQPPNEAEGEIYGTFSYIKDKRKPYHLSTLFGSKIMWSCRCVRED